VVSRYLKKEQGTFSQDPAKVRQALVIEHKILRCKTYIVKYILLFYTALAYFTVKLHPERLEAMHNYPKEMDCSAVCAILVTNVNGTR
jgi:hypothetical protein